MLVRLYYTLESEVSKGSMTKKLRSLRTGMAGNVCRWNGISG